jgi:drug/metabolite transporter (DMT)-like permease
VTTIPGVAGELRIEGTAIDRGRSIGRLAIALGVVVVASIVSLAVFYAVGGPFGAINDLGNALVGILSALLAWTWRPRGMESTLRAATIGAAVLGAAITVVGTALVETTGFFFAGLVSSVGFALIGLWLVALNRSIGTDGRWPRRLPTLGLVVGLLMALGFAAAPGIAMGLDDMGAAPWWIWIGFLGWIGTYLLYPVWSIWLGRGLLSGAMPVT